MFNQKNDFGIPKTWPNSNSLINPQRNEFSINKIGKGKKQREKDNIIVRNYADLALLTTQHKPSPLSLSLCSLSLCNSLLLFIALYSNPKSLSLSSAFKSTLTSLLSLFALIDLVLIQWPKASSISLTISFLPKVLLFIVYFLFLIFIWFDSKCH